MPNAAAAKTGIHGGGGAGGGGAPDGSVAGLTDGGAAQGTGSAACVLCGMFSADGGCPDGLTANYENEPMGMTCVCVAADGGSSCEFCSSANPNNGGCAAGQSCVTFCQAGGSYQLCAPAGSNTGCYSDAGL